jgi:hypothetical protein
MPPEREKAPPTSPGAAIQLLTPAVVAVFTSIASQAALITALLYFFGRVRTSAKYGYFGVDTNSLGFSTSDYVIRSLNATLPPVIVCALAILAVLAIAKHLDRAVDFTQQRPRIKRATLIATAVVILACVLVIVNGISNLRTASYSRGYPLPIAVLGIAAAVGMGRRLLAPNAHPTHSTHRLWSMAVAAFALAGVLWITDIYAAADGNREGRDTANTLRSPTSTDFVLYSVDRLLISGPGVQSSPITTPDSRYHVQYSGLRLLVRTAREYVILPAAWQPGDPVIVLPVDDSTRFDLIPHPEPT